MKFGFQNTVILILIYVSIKWFSITTSPHIGVCWFLISFQFFLLRPEEGAHARTHTHTHTNSTHARTRTRTHEQKLCILLCLPIIMQNIVYQVEHKFSTLLHLPDFTILFSNYPSAWTFLTYNNRKACTFAKVACDAWRCKLHIT
jgi:hypothetical protein